MNPDSGTQSDGLWIIDNRGVTIFANAAMADLLGARVNDLIGRNSFEYVFPEDLAAAEKLFAMKQAGNRAPFRFKLRRADGSSIWTDVQGTPMHNAAGEFLGIVGTFTISQVQGQFPG